MGVIVTINDLRTAKMCARAARPWFVRHGLSWSDYIARGIDADSLTATRDVLALKVVAIAETRVKAEANRG